MTRSLRPVPWASRGPLVEALSLPGPLSLCWGHPWASQQAPPCTIITNTPESPSLDSRPRVRGPWAGGICVAPAACVRTTAQHRREVPRMRLMREYRFSGGVGISRHQQVRTRRPQAPAQCTAQVPRPRAPPPGVTGSTLAAAQHVRPGG